MKFKRFLFEYDVYIGNAVKDKDFAMSHNKGAYGWFYDTATGLVWWKNETYFLYVRNKKYDVRKSEWAKEKGWDPYLVNHITAEDFVYRELGITVDPEIQGRILRDKILVWNKEPLNRTEKLLLDKAVDQIYRYVK